MVDGGDVVFVDGIGVVVIGGGGGAGGGCAVADVSVLNTPPVNVESGGVSGGIVVVPSVVVGCIVSSVIGIPNWSTVGGTICGA